MAAPLFIHSLFRAGSTYFWSEFRKSSDRYWCYQEPLHEVVLDYKDRPEALLDFRSDEITGYLRHPKLDRPYYFELVAVFESCRDCIGPDIIYRHYFRDTADEPLFAYFRALSEAARGIPVIQECRTAGRIGPIKQALGGFHVYLWRNPWDQWWSYKVNNYFEAINQVILNAADRPPVIDRLRAEIGFVPYEGQSLRDEINHYEAAPLSSELRYLVFYTLWVHALTEALRSADLLVNVDTLSDSDAYKEAVATTLAGAGFGPLDFRDCKVPQAFFTADDRQFLRRIETRAHGLLLASGYPESLLETVKALRSEHQPALWDNGAAVVPLQQAAVQSSRIRQVVIRVETEGSDRQRELVRSQQQETLRLSAQWTGRLSELERESAAAIDAIETRERQLYDKFFDAQGAWQNAERMWAQQAIAAADKIAALLQSNAARERELHDRVIDAQARMLELQRSSERAFEAQRARYESLLSAVRNLFNSRAWRFTGIGRSALALIFSEKHRIRSIESLLASSPTHPSRAEQPGASLQSPLQHVDAGNQSVEIQMSTPIESIGALMQLDGMQFIEGAYRLVLQRAVDADGRNTYFGRLETGVAKHRIVRALLDSPEAGALHAHTGGLRDALDAYLRRMGHHYELQNLLACNGEKFIERAYRVLLRRPPDRQERQFYLQELTGGAPKIRILGALAGSDEARASGSVLPGLATALLAHRLACLPVVGGIFRLVIRATEGNSLADRRLRAMEQRLAEFSVAGGTSSAPRARARLTNAAAAGPLTFFTICSKNFTAYARTLYDSVMRHHPDAAFYLVLCDEVSADYAPERQPFPVIALTELEIPDVREMALRYNITEFNTSLKPFAFAHFFRRLGKSCVVYVDPDILLTSRLEEVVDEFSQGADCILTPHVLEPAENVEVSDIKMLLFGIYNLGFIGLRNTPGMLRIIDWWGRRLERECVIDLPRGLFVDQKWADLLPAYVPNTCILHHAGYNVAYWNLSQRVIKFIDGTWYANDSPLRFVHFSGNKLDDPNVFSRHSWSITVDSIGDLRQLLDTYREMVNGNGHAEYSKLPYSFSWDGAGGVNLHTPRPGLLPDMGPGAPPVWRPRLLFVDVAVPRPDRDAGSITAIHLLRIFANLGYDVTFIPSDLQERGEYSDAVRQLGVVCLHREDIGSVRDHLITHGSGYQYVFVCRAPIAGLFIDDLRKYARSAKLILNTSDLHYLRDMREAEVSGNEQKLARARETKTWELGILGRFDVVIVMSTAEEELLKGEIPDTDVRLMPLMYVEAVAEYPGYEARRDILFIGGFPHMPNVDAVIYFCAEIFPLVRRDAPDIQFHVVGDAPPPQVQELANRPGIVVHGFVKDIAPLFRSCRLSVAPLRYGAGIKGKIGTSLAYGVPVVATSVAVEGMQLTDREHVFVADSPQEFANRILDLYGTPETWERLSRLGREQVIREYSPEIGQLRIRKLMESLGVQPGQIDLHVLKCESDYANLKVSLQGELLARAKLEHSLIRREEPKFLIPGFCAVCGMPSTFNTSFLYAYQHDDDGELIPNWREHLVCTRCGFWNRIRAAMHIFYGRIRPARNAALYVTEQSTALFRWLQARHGRIVGSEYLGDAVPLGTESNGLRNEDITRLTFDAGSFDYVLSFDVMEHVSDDQAAYREIHRCLKPGGVFLFAAPFASDRAEKVIRARINADGGIEHLLPAEYHGNPVDPENGALCFRYLAWDIFADLQRAGFRDVEVLHYWSRDFAYFGVEQFMFVARK